MKEYSLIICLILFLSRASSRLARRPMIIMIMKMMTRYSINEVKKRQNRTAVHSALSLTGSNLVQRLLQVSDQVVHILQSKRDADQVVHHADRTAVVLGVIEE